MRFKVHNIQNGLDCPEYFGILDTQTSLLLRLIIKSRDPNWILEPIQKYKN